MLARTIIPQTPTLVEEEALTALLTEPEAALSDAPVYSPEAKGEVLLLVVASPKAPKEPKEK